MDDGLLSIENLYLIDDSDDEAFLANRMLKREKVEVTINAHGTLASFLDCASTESGFLVRQALVVVDLYLDLEMGTDVIAQLTASHPDLIVGMSTGSEDPRDRQKALDVGAWFFIGKPLDLTCLQSICGQTGVVSLIESAEGEKRMYRTLPASPDYP